MYLKHIGSKYAVRTELKRGGPSRFYKHIVPTGLKKLPKYFINLHTVCGTVYTEFRFSNRTDHNVQLIF